MSTKDLTFDDSRQWEIVEQIGEHFPDVVIFVLSNTFIVEPVALGDRPGLVIASQDGDSVFVSE